MSKTFALSFAVGAGLTGGFLGTFKAAKKNIGSLGSAIKSLESGQTKLTRFKNLKTGINQTEKALVTAQSEVAKLARAMRQTDKPTAKMTANFNRAKASARRLKSQLDSEKASLHALRGELSAAGLKTRGLAQQQDRLAKSITRAKKAQSGLQSLAAAQNKNAQARDNYRTQAVDAFALGYALQAPFRAAISFEQSMAEVKSISGATGKEFNALSAQAKLLGRNTQFSASEAAAGMKFLSMAGFETNETLAAMPGLLDLAKAAGSDLAFTADAASDILSAFHKEADQMGTVGDVLTKTFTTSNTSMELLAETMKYVGPVAYAAGMSLQETAAMAGMLGNVGIKGSQAGTAMRSAITRLAGPPRMAAKALKGLGVTTKDAAGNMLPVVDILSDIAAKTETMGSGDRLEAFKKIFGVEAAAAMTELVGQAGSEGIQKYIKEVEKSQGAAAKVAKIQADTTQGTLKALGSAMESLAIASATLFFPAIRAASGALKGLANFTTAAVEKFPMATTVLGGLVAGLAAAKIASLGLGYTWTFLKGGALAMKGAYLGIQAALALAKGKMIAFGVASKAAAIGQGLMTSAQWALNVALNANPIGLVVAGVAALGAAAYVVYRNWDTIKTSVLGFWDSVTGFFSNFSLAESGVKIVKTLASGILSASMAPFNAVKSVFTKVRNLLPFSDAKEGPLSSLTKSGAAIVTTLGQGINRAGSGPIGDSLANSMAKGVQDGLTGSGSAPAQGGAAGSGSGSVFHITIAPKIYIGAGADPSEVKRNVGVAMDESEGRLKELLERFANNERRLSFA